MLLIAGGESDPNTQRIVDQAHIRELPYHFLNTDDADANQIAWDFESPGIDIGPERFSPTSMYLRCNVFGSETQVSHMVHDLLQAYAFAWPQIRILNRGCLTDLNNKSFNLRLARDVGFTIPESLVMGQLGPLTSMPEAENRIAKPLNGGAHTLVISELAADPTALLNAGPQFIQERLLGENLRLFSIGGELTCFHLRTTKVDYREDENVEVIQVDVPIELVDPTQKLVAAKKFDYCALDFRSRNGFEEPVFLEVNSFPMFVRFDDSSENRLANQVLDFLK